MKTRLLLPILLLSFSLHPVVTLAQWQLDGTALSTAAHPQNYMTSVSDGAGGSIVTWEDTRGSSIPDIYARRINAAGVVQWTADGVAVCTAANAQYNPVIASDGVGGAIIAWSDLRIPQADFNIYAQRVSAAGVVMWKTDGWSVCAAADLQRSPRIVSDGSGGAIIAWVDLRTGSYFDIYAQRINAAGAVQWTANGVALCTAANNQDDPTIASDGAGGAIVTWFDDRNGTDSNIYAQRINAAGTVQWAANGVALCTAADDQQHPKIVSDGSGGAIVTWPDFRNTTDWDMYAQRVNAAGAVQWTTNGVALSTVADAQWEPAIASDGSGGAIVAWQDWRSSIDADIYAQRVSASGAIQWTANGVALTSGGVDQYRAAIVSDGGGGAIVTWETFEMGGINKDVYAQRINAAGAVLWMTDGVAVSKAAGWQQLPTIISDGAGEAIITWQDWRSGMANIYAQRVEPDFGTWGHPEPTVTAVADVPNDQGGKVSVNWKASGHDALPFQEIGYYSVWRAVDPVSAAYASNDPDGGADPATIGPNFHGRAVAHERIGTTDYYWEWVSNQNATHDAGYSFAASTREDSLAGDSAPHYFRVLAHTSNPYVLYKSNVMSGHSVDNLAPAAPLMLTAQRAGADVHLKWNGVHVPDLKDYAVYRATSSGVTPIPGNFLADDVDTMLVDPGAPTSALYYIVTALDVHQNQSDPSNEASVSALTSVGQTPSIATLTVLPNHPNPFTGETELEIGLPQAGAIHLEVYDVAGRRVRTMDMPGVKGWQKVPFSGTNDRGEPLASGVYFYKVKASGTKVTRRMVIAR